MNFQGQMHDTRTQAWMIQSSVLCAFSHNSLFYQVHISEIIIKTNKKTDTFGNQSFRHYFPHKLQPP